MRTRYRYDRDLECVVEIGGNYYEEPPQGPFVIGDDVGAGVNGLRHMASGKMLDSKSRHRAENRARGLREVGNQQDFASKQESKSLGYYERQVSDTLDQLRSNHNGVADRMRQENQADRYRRDNRR